VERLEAGLDASGKPLAWLHRSVAPSIGSTFKAGVKNEIPIELGLGFVNTPFQFPNARFENPEAEAHTRIGWFRSVSNIPHAFAIQSFAAELAAAAGRDPKDYLLELIGPARKIDPYSIGDKWNHGEDPARYPIDTGRLRAVIETAASAIGWGLSMPKGHGLGIAGHYSFVTYVAVAVEVVVSEKGELSIPKADIAVDCGPRVNPDRIRAQMEGTFIMGQSLALLSEITFKNRAVEQGNFDTYQVARIDAAPPEISVLRRRRAGPAACCACDLQCDLCRNGKRIRSLPLKDQLQA
jgi:isoquinoline 1-oxidoreductase beta subunit